MCHRVTFALAASAVTSSLLDIEIPTKVVTRKINQPPVLILSWLRSKKSSRPSLVIASCTIAMITTANDSCMNVRRANSKSHGKRILLGILVYLEYVPDGLLGHFIRNRPKVNSDPRCKTVCFKIQEFDILHK